MSALTWAELSQRKMDYVCTHGLDNWEYCRAIARHFRWEEQAEQWMIAAFIGTAFILASVAVSMLLADRRQRTVPVPRETPATPARTYRPKPPNHAKTLEPAVV